MYEKKARASRRVVTIVLSSATALLSLGPFCERADAIPAFTRQYLTSCMTCHANFPKLNSLGEAFRRNGYQFPLNDELLVKDEPISLGAESYKELWPNSIWPSHIPHLPPVAFRARLGFQGLLESSDDEPSTDFRFPMDYSLLTGGTFDEDISWYAGVVLAGIGGHGGGHDGDHGAAEETTLESELERMFVQFSNLFAWASEDDENGMRQGSRWFTVPRHAMNLRLGQFEPQVVAPWASIHRQIGIAARLPNVATIGGNHFQFEPALRGLELHGTLHQNNSYAIGLVNGNGVGSAWDNNSNKDYYFRVARKWWGFPLDGVLGQLEESDDAAGDIASTDDDSMAPVGLDFWREMQFETGFFGYFGRNMASVTTEEHMDVLLAGGGTLEIEVTTTTMRLDRFQRIGFDARFQHQDLDIFGAAIWGWDSDPISDDDPAVIEPDRLFTWFIEADYYFKPWLTAYGRYEQLSFDDDERQEEAGQSRAVVGSVFMIRANMRFVDEFVIDTQNNGTNDNTFTALLDFSY